MPAFGYQDDAHKVDEKIAEWMKQALQTMKKEEEENDSDATKVQNLKNLIKDIEKKKLTFMAKVPHTITFRQLVYMLTNDNEAALAHPYILRQCTREQIQKLFDLPQNSDPNSPKMLKAPNIPQKALSATPLLAMDNLLKAVKLGSVGILQYMESTLKHKWEGKQQIQALEEELALSRRAARLLSERLRAAEAGGSDSPSHAAGAGV